MDSFIGWVGGKKLLRKAICDRFPSEVSKYVEVFGGAGWVLFYRDRHAEFEVYNDINSRLVNLFRCMKYHPDAVALELDFLLNSREIFNHFKNQDTNGLTDIQKAARYLYLIRASYGSKTKDFGIRARDITKADVFRDIQKRLSKVVIENKSFDALIKQYDGPQTLFYCDPPYHGAESFYDTGAMTFNDEQHVILKDTLTSIKGKFILSSNDCEYIRTLYNSFSIENVSRQNNLAARYGKEKIYSEVIIKNF